MAVRDDLCLEIPIHLLGRFECGKQINLTVPASWDFRQGDLLRWRCLDFTGFAKVVLCRLVADELVCIFQEP